MALWDTRRFISMNIMIAGFVIIINGGQLAVALFVMALQLGISYEVWSVGIQQELECHVKYLNKLRWYILIIGTYYIADGWILMDIILQQTNNWILIILFKNHLLYSFILSSIGLIWFVLELNNANTQLLQYQYGQLAWNLTNHLMMVHIAPIIRVTFAGMIWSILPMSIVVANDIFAYGFGKLFGKHQLTQLSPKKTWEGYILSGITTIPFGYWLAFVLMKYNTFLCPTNQFIFGLFQCQRHEIFIKTEYNIYGYIINIEPFQIYTLFISLFIAIICPIGGFIASGFKRGFGLKDYGSMIPGHGGITDRMDGEVLMCSFVYLLHKTIMMRYHPMTLNEIEMELTNPSTNKQQISLLIKVLETLTN